VRAIESKVFLRKETKLPEQLQLQGQAMDTHWLVLPCDAYALDQKVRAAGWHFFWLTEKVDAWAAGINRETAVDTALRKALEKVAPSRNVAEVIGIRYRLLCGFQLCKVRLAVRHIQPEMTLGIAPSVGMISPIAASERWTRPGAQTHGVAA